MAWLGLVLYENSLVSTAAASRRRTALLSLHPAEHSSVAEVFSLFSYALHFFDLPHMVEELRN